MRVNTQKSVFVAGQHPAIPTAQRHAVKLWGYLSVIAVAAGLVAAFFAGWHWALIGIVVAVLIVKGNQASATQFIAEAAKADPAFRAEMVKSKIITE